MDANLTANQHGIIDPDAELVTLAIKELPYRTRAYEQLIQRYEKLLFRVCANLLGNNDDALDVSQEVMVKVFKYLPRFEGRSTFKTWLMQIARNTSFTMQAKLKRQRELRDMLEHEVNVEENYSQMETSSRDIDTILSELNEQDREALTMRFIAELQFDEIADACDISLSAAKMRVYRATDALKKKMADQEG